MNTMEHVNKAIAECKKNNLECEWYYGNGCIKFLVKGADRIVVMAKTPSDKRAIQNCLSEVKRAIRSVKK